MLTGGGRGKEAAKTAVQEAIGSGRGKYPGKTAINKLKALGLTDDEIAALAG